jgi:DNA-binding NarL/FixJ family response regulator
MIMAPDKIITILLAEDHVVVRQGLSSLLKADGHFLVVGEARTGREAVDMAKELIPDVILMDIAMPILNGLEATRQILAVNPAARVIMLSAHSDDEYIKRMHEVGAVGFLEKQSSAEVLTKAIREIALGRNYYSAAIIRRLRHSQDMLTREGGPKLNGSQLTRRESEVLQLVAEGMANKQIAGELKISIKTVEKHRQHLMDKLDIHETAGLTRYAIAQGVIQSDTKTAVP